MNKIHSSINEIKILLLLILALSFNVSVSAGEDFTSYDKIKDCECYSSGLSTSYIAVEIDDILPHLRTAYQFTLVDLGGDLSIDSYDADPNYTMTYNSDWGGYGKTRSFDHPSPEYDKLFKHQVTRPFALSIRIGPKWSRALVFPPGPAVGLVIFPR